jgi:hypothetical protein
MIKENRVLEIIGKIPKIVEKLGMQECEFE